MCMAQFLTNRNRGCITEIVSKRIQPMQYEGLITFLLIQLIAIATEPYYAAITATVVFALIALQILLNVTKMCIAQFSTH